MDFYGINLTNPFHGFGSGISFYDFNQDGWDDLTMGGGASDPVFLLNNGGTLEPIDLGITNPGGAWIQALLWVDYNNDGNPDLFISKYDGSVELWKNSGDLNFTNVAAEAGLNTGSYAHTNATFGDYNHDGCLDLYVSKYYNYYLTNDHPELAGTLYKNNCDGTFTDVTESSGVYVTPHQALQPTFTDINNDGWEDLFIAVDRIGFPNELFLNNQDGTFTRITESAGVQDHIDAMSSTIADFNHNQLLDIFVTNNPIATGNLLYRNNGDSTFTDIAGPMGVNLMHECWGALWIDYDNDSWEDLFVSRLSGQVTSVGNHFFKNNAGDTFSQIQDDVGINAVPSNTFVVAKGDLNNDGYYDFANGNREPFTHRIYQNAGGDNNYISVTLEGTLANRDGIGTWIHCYVGGDHLVNFVQCGENLSGQDSRKNIFGIGSSAEVDSLVLEWNSGTREVYMQPEINTHHYFIEGASFTQPFNIEHGDTVLCAGQSTQLDAGAFESYLWNTGDTTQSILVSEPGTYFVEAWNAFGLLATSFPVEVAVAPPAEINVEKTNVSCAGANNGAIEVTFSNGPVAEIVWNTGDTVTTLEDLDPNVYSFTATDDFGCPVEGSVAIDEPSPLLGQANTEDATCFGNNDGSAALNIIGGSPPYSADWLGQNPEALYAGDYLVMLTDSNGCSLEIDLTIDQPDSLALDLLIVNASNGESNGAALLSISGGTPPYSISWSTGDADVLNIFDLAPTNYTVSVTDDKSCTAQTSFDVHTNTGMDSRSEHPEWRIVPNPNRGIFGVSGLPGGKNEVRVFNSYGQLVWDKVASQSVESIDLSDVKAGIYYLHVTTESYGEVLRVVITE